MNAPHRRGRVRAGALTVAAALLMTTAPAVSAGSASPLRLAAGDVSTCRGALTPLALPAETPAPAVLTQIDGVSADSVYVYENEGEGQSGDALLLHGPSTGPFVRTTGLRPDMTVWGLVAVDERHAWVAGEASDAQRSHRLLEVWRADGDVVSKAPIPLRLISPDLWTTAYAIDGASDDDVWVSVDAYDRITDSSSQFILHWDGRAWKRFELPPASAGLGSLSAIGEGAAIATTSDGDSQRTWWRLDDTGWHPLESPGPNVALTPGGHTRPVAAPDFTATTPLPPLRQWRDGAWHTLPAPPLGRGRVTAPYRVGPDGTVAAVVNTAANYRNPSTPLKLIVLDGEQWVSMGTLDNPALHLVGQHASLVAPISATDVLQISEGSGSRPIPASLQRSCFPQVGASGISPARVQAEVGLPVAVRADAALGSPAVLTDDLRLRPTVRIQPGHWGELSYPWPGTFTATLKGSGGTFTTTTTMGYVEKVNLDGRVLSRTLQVAAMAPPTGWTVEVQAQAPGGSTWSLLTRTNEKSLPLAMPTDAPTVTHYRARLVRTDGTAKSGWSADTEIKLG